MSGTSQLTSTGNDVWLGFNSPSTTTLSGNSSISAAGSLTIGEDQSGNTPNSNVVYLHASAHLNSGNGFAIGYGGQASAALYQDGANSLIAAGAGNWVIGGYGGSDPSAGYFGYWAFSAGAATKTTGSGIFWAAPASASSINPALRH